MNKVKVLPLIDIDNDTDMPDAAVTLVLTSAEEDQIARLNFIPPDLKPLQELIARRST